MKTITQQEFTDNFMEISRNLTVAELQLLYLFITEPASIKLSQEKISDKIYTHRRTVNIGIKNLLKFEYISDINSIDQYIWAFNTKTWEFLDERFFLSQIGKGSLPQRTTNSHKYIIDTIDSQLFEMKIFDLVSGNIFGEGLSKKFIQTIKGESDTHINPNMKAITVNIDQLLYLKGTPTDFTKEKLFKALLQNYERCYIVELSRKL